MAASKPGVGKRLGMIVASTKAVRVAADLLGPVRNRVTGTVLALAALLSLRIPAPRLILHPLILAGTIYLWDTTLPPPSLPEGPLRGLVPRAILLGALTDGLLAISRAQRARCRAIRIVAGYLTLDDAVLLCGTTVDDLRSRLGRAGRTTRIGDDGRKYVALADLHDLI